MQHIVRGMFNQFYADFLIFHYFAISIIIYWPVMVINHFSDSVQNADKDARDLDSSICYWYWSNLQCLSQLRTGAKNAKVHLLVRFHFDCRKCYKRGGGMAMQLPCRESVLWYSSSAISTIVNTYFSSKNCLKTY